MTEQNSPQPLHYKGWQSNYIDIAVRGTDEHLGLSVEYVSDGKVSGFLLRFVVHGEGVQPKKYKHLMYREPAKFVIPPTETTGAEMFTGVRLNKIGIKVFEPAVPKWELEAYADKFNILPMLTEWVADQVLSEGFTVTVQLQAVIRELVGIVKPAENVKCILEFPDLTSPEQQASALKQVKAPEPEPEPEEDEDEEDDDKPWVN